MSSSLNLLKRSLSSKAGWVTRSIKACDDVIKVTPLDSDELRLSVQVLKERWSSYLDTQAKYEEAVIASADKEAESTLTTAQSAHDDWLTRYYGKLREYETALRLNIVPPVPENQTGLKVKLPKVELPEFSGDITLWIGFKEKFDSLVGNNPNITNIDKLVYLLGQLKGDAFRLVSELKVEAANYDVAINILETNYQDKELTKHLLIGKLLNLEAPTKHEFESLQQFRISVSCILGSLKLVQNIDGAEWLIQDLIQRKLPVKTVEVLNSQYQKNFFSVKELEEGLMTICKHLQTIKGEANVGSGTKPKPNKADKKSNSNKQVNKHQEFKPPFWKEKDHSVGTYVVQAESDASPTQSVQTTERPMGPRIQRDCLFCHGDHGTVRCNQYTSLTSRMKRMQELKLCFVCLGSNHKGSECKTKIRLCALCKQERHHSALCPRQKEAGGEVPVPNRQTAKPPEKQDKPVVAKMSLAEATPPGPKVLLKPAAVPLAETVLSSKNKDHGTSVITMFDTAAQLSFIDRALSEQLGLKPVGTQKIAVEGFLAKQEFKEYQVVKPLVRFGRYKCRVKAVVQDNKETIIHTNGYKEVTDSLKDKLVKLAPLTVNSDNIGPVKFFIGADYYGRFARRIIKRGGVELLTSCGGDMIFGPLPINRNEKASVKSVVITPQCSVMVARIGADVSPTDIEEVLEEETLPVHKLWDLDTIGIDANKPSPEELECTRLFKDEIQYQDGQYWVGLPWKANPPELRSGYAGAKHQLRQLKKRLGNKEKGMLQMYDKLIREQESSGFIERVNTPIYSKGHYLPHHAVWRESKTTPMRIVFNCSYKPSKDSPSLNDCLYTGPSLTEKLADILIGFRQKEYAYTADISKAFLRIGLLEKDREYTKFLWFEDPDREDSPLITYRFKSVLFGSCSSPFLLCGTLQHHFEKAGLDSLSKTFYMDNLQGVTSSTHNLKQIYSVANKECKSANLPLQSWNSNSPELNRIIEEDYPGYTRPNEQKMLGLLWDTNEDNLSIVVPSYGHSILSKRTLLSLTSRLFDPLGWLAPLTIKGKILIQDAWAEKLDWDVPLGEQYQIEWSALKEELEQVDRLQIPRRIDSGEGDANLHIFCDAAKRAYGAVAYYVNDNESHLIMSKARVAPLKTRSLPQMELTAIELGVKLAKYLQTVIKGIKQAFIWTDSEICLYWIAREKCTIPYVQNRVKTINSLSSETTRFMHVPSGDNPADLLSRGLSLAQFKSDSKWFNGPQWILCSDNWPSQKPYQEPAEDPIQVKAIQVDAKEPLIEVERFSKLERLVNALSLIKRFMKTDKDLLTQVIKDEQRKCVPPVLDDLQTGHRKLKLTKDLGLHLDGQGVIRCRGRITEADVPLATKQPILLPRNSHLTKLIVENSHKLTLHAGVGDTLAHIRQRYWIPRGRQTVKSILKDCIHCKRYDRGMMQYPGPPVLPADRVAEGRPFEVCGVDYTGAITLTGDGVSSKHYICLFTCAKIRAIHLEVVDDLTSEGFINAFRRFAARRSCPRKIISDNGTNFVGAEPLLREIFEHPDVKTMLKVRNCTWHFVTPRAPWQNGFTERLIGVVKGSLRKTLHKSRINADELRTVITEIESRVNNRPLTYIDSSNVTIEPITPSHLLYGYRLETIPQVNLEDQVEDPDVETSSTRKDLIKSYNNMKKRLDAWDRHWCNDYLLSLRERSYGGSPAVNYQPVKIGDVVLLRGDQPRSSWPLGKIIETYPDAEGVIRSVKVRSGQTETIRTINRLLPLELSVVDPDPPNPTLNPTVTNDTSRRPTRVAAQGSQSNWRNLITQGSLT